LINALTQIVVVQVVSWQLGVQQPIIIQVGVQFLMKIVAYALENGVDRNLQKILITDNNIKYNSNNITN